MSKRDKLSFVLLLVLVAITAGELYLGSSRTFGWLMLGLTIVSALRFGLTMYAKRGTRADASHR
jgi:hypothetical protein